MRALAKPVVLSSLEETRRYVEEQSQALLGVPSAKAFERLKTDRALRGTIVEVELLMLRDMLAQSERRNSSR